MEEDFDNEDMIEQQGLIDIIIPPQIISDPLHQIKFQEIKSIMEEANSLSDYIKQDAKQLENIIKNSDKLAFLGVHLTCYILNPTPSPICSATVGYSHLNNKIFKCFDCMEANNAIQCIECFSKADHKGHQYFEAFSGEGCCDCGNEQMFNPKGFCPRHSKKIDKVQIDEKVRRKFLIEGAFYFYINFWLLDRAQIFDLSQEIVKNQVKKIMNKIHEISRKDYDQKWLVYELMKQKLQQVFPNLPKVKKGEMTILEMFFNWQQQFPEMEIFCRIINEIFPVEQSRIDVIKCFFHKTRTDPTFDFHHPLRFINFQFMTCIKTINNLITKGQLQPLELPPLQKIKQAQAGNLLFLKFLEDMQYIIDMKGTSEYHRHLIENCNVATILSLYRQLPDNQLYKNVLDNYYLKTFRHILRNIKNQPKLLMKMMKELWQYIIKINQPNLSLIHERMFAFTISTYLGGQLSKLDQPFTLNGIKNVLNLQENFIEIFSDRAAYHLQNYVNCFVEPYISIPNDNLWEFFTSHNPQIALGFKLDYLYQKILILLSLKTVDYPSIICQIVKKGMDSYQLYHLFSFLNGITTVEADQIEIESQIQINNKERLELFYTRFVKTFAQLKPVELKKKCLAIIHNPSSFQSFVTRCEKEKGSIVVSAPCQPLEFLGYQIYLRTLQIETAGLPQKNYNMKKLPYLKDVELWNNDSAEVLITLCRSIFEQRKGEIKNYNQDIFFPSKFGFEVIKAYLLSQNQYLQQFLSKELLAMSESANCSALSNTIKIVLSLPSNLNVTEYNNEENKRNKQLLLEKKKEKQERLKQNRDAILSKHKVEDKKTEGDICIFCRENTEEQLYLLSSVGLDNLVTKFILKAEPFRLCFRTCGHKIHQKCYFQDQNLLENQCFLCRRSTNLLLPHFSAKSKLESSNSFDFSFFLNMLYMTLVECATNGEQQKIVHQFNERYCQKNMARAVVNSIICEILLFQDNQEGHARRYVVPIMKELINFLRQIPQEYLQNAFKVDKKIMTITGENAQLYFRAREILEQYFFNQKKLHSQSSFDQKIHQILSLFDGSQSNPCSIKELTCIKVSQYLFDLPKNLSDLQHFMGECPSCHKVTESVCLCLVCGYRVCSREKEKLIEHFNLHLGGCVFIKCDSGMPLYLLQGLHLFLRKSIYLNYVGEPFENGFFVKQKARDFNLDKQKYELISQKIVRGEVKSLVMKELT